MDKKDIIGNLHSHKRQASQLCPTAVVVSIEQAEKALTRMEKYYEDKLKKDGRDTEQEE